MKREITTFNIFELTVWLDKCVNRLNTKKINEIHNLINDSQSSSRYLYFWVDEIWDDNCEHVINLN